MTSNIKVTSGRSLKRRPEGSDDEAADSEPGLRQRSAKCLRRTVHISDDEVEPEGLHDQAPSPVVISSSTASPEDDHQPERRGAADVDNYWHSSLTYKDVFGTPDDKTFESPSKVVSLLHHLGSPAGPPGAVRQLFPHAAALSALKSTPVRTDMMMVSPAGFNYCGEAFQGPASAVGTPMALSTPIIKVGGADTSRLLSPAGGPPYVPLFNGGDSGARPRCQVCLKPHDARDCMCLERDDRGEYIRIQTDPRNKIYPPTGAFYDLQTKRVKLTVDCFTRTDRFCCYPDYTFCTANGRKCNTKLCREETDALMRLDMWG